MTTPAIRAALERLLCLLEPFDTSTLALGDAITDALDALAAADPADGGEALLAAAPDGSHGQLILQWSRSLPPSEECPHCYCTAQTPFGQFRVAWQGQKEHGCPTVDETPWGDQYGPFGSVGEAKAECQLALDARLAGWIRPAVEKETEKLRLLFDETRHQMADSLGVDRGYGWTSLAMEACNLRSAATPAADWVEPSDEQLIDVWNENSEYYALYAEACNFARAVLTRWGRLAAPAALVDGEVGELVAWLNNHAAHLRTMEGIGALPETELQERLDRVATLLQQQAAELAALRTGVMPVPVSERPWDREGWCDEEGRCWFLSSRFLTWSLESPPVALTCQIARLHSLPFHALPLPWPTDPPAAGQRQPLSPVEEVQERYQSAAGEYPDPDGLAATIRALADHVIHERCQNESEKRIYDRLRRVAAELEGADG